MTAGDGDLLTVVAVNAFGVVGVAIRLFDFFVVQKCSVVNLDPLGVVVFLLGLAVVMAARRTPRK